MKNVTSSETSKRLKDAGFPQPPFQVGQSWYDVSGELFWVKCDESPYIHGEWWGDDHSGFVEIPHGDEVFAPTATDIIEQLPSQATLRKPFNAELWICEYGEGEDDWTEASTAPEAAALAFLNLNPKKDLQE